MKISWTLALLTVVSLTVPCYASSAKCSKSSTTTTTSGATTTNNNTSSSASSIATANPISNSNSSLANSGNSTASATGGSLKNSGNSSATGGSLTSSGNSTNSNVNTVSGGQGGSATGGTSSSQGGSASSSNNSTGSGNSTSVSSTYNQVRQTPMAYAPDAISTAPCVKGYSAGASGPMFGASFGAGKIDKGCDTRETAREFALMNNFTAAAKLLCSTDAAKRAKLTLKDCMAFSLPLNDTISDDTTKPAAVPAMPNPTIVAATPTPEPKPAVTTNSTTPIVGWPTEDKKISQ